MREVGLRLKLLVQMMMVIMIVIMSVLMRTDDHGFAASARMIDDQKSDGESAKQKAADGAVELTLETFNTSLWASPAPSVIVEFYAHWCPACQNFKPQYERVAQLFNGLDAVYPGVLLLAKVDCAEEINRKLCQRFSVKHYPTMLFGKPSTFAWGSRLEDNDQNFEDVGSRMSAQALLDWINTHLKKSYSLDPAIQRKQSKQAIESVSVQVVSIHDIDEATAEAYNIILNEKLVGSSQRAPFVQFLQLLTAYHPSRRCRAGSAQILFNLVDIWPNEHIAEVHERGTERADVAALKQLQICGKDLPRNIYKTCDMATGGYSCGLWYLFHALSVRVDDSESKNAMKAISDFVANFFPCEECRQHFSKISQSAMDSISTRRNLTLWIWRAHNEVNRRLAKQVEASVESQRSKLQWPPRALCPPCRMSSEDAHGDADEDVEWDEDEVYEFLRKTYGQSILVVADEAKTLGNNGDETGVEENLTSSAAPVGAAVGIAMASCGFGVAACCWRVQQKKRKRMRKRGV
ncbi:unnamed protein product [Calypogeia fissa]